MPYLVGEREPKEQGKVGLRRAFEVLLLRHSSIDASMSLLKAFPGLALSDKISISARKS